MRRPKISPPAQFGPALSNPKPLLNSTRSVRPLFERNGKFAPVFKRVFSSKISA